MPDERARLTPAQINALVNAATLLDHLAGEGAGMMPKERMGEPLWADEVCLSISEAFGFEWGDNLGLAVRRILEEGSMTDDIDRIVRGLSDRQKRALRTAKTWGDGKFYVSHFDALPPSLIACGVWGRGDELTPLGIAVRNRILEPQQ